MFDKILVAIDDSEHTGRLLTIAGDFATKFGAEIFVLHVLETGFVGKAGVVNLESSDDVHKLVNDAVATFTSQGLKATGTVRAGLHGRVALEIFEQAHEVGAQAIVTGTHGLGSIEGMLVGSTTQKLLHVTDLPVLVVP
jgi:nucleotide-binding universal stress UspA family protein